MIRDNEKRVFVDLLILKKAANNVHSEPLPPTASRINVQK